MKRTYEIQTILASGEAKTYRIQIQNTKAAKDRLRQAHPEIVRITKLRFVPEADIVGTGE